MSFLKPFDPYQTRPSQGGAPRPPNVPTTPQEKPVSLNSSKRTHEDYTDEVDFVSCRPVKRRKTTTGKQESAEAVNQQAPCSSSQSVVMQNISVDDNQRTRPRPLTGPDDDTAAGSSLDRRANTGMIKLAAPATSAESTTTTATTKVANTDRSVSITREELKKSLDNFTFDQPPRSPQSRVMSTPPLSPKQCPHGAVQVKPASRPSSTNNSRHDDELPMTPLSSSFPFPFPASPSSSSSRQGSRGWPCYCFQCAMRRRRKAIISCYNHIHHTAPVCRCFCCPTNIAPSQQQQQAPRSIMPSYRAAAPNGQMYNFSIPIPIPTTCSSCLQRPINSLKNRPGIL